MRGGRFEGQGDEAAPGDFLRSLGVGEVKIIGQGAGFLTGELPAGRGAVVVKGGVVAVGQGAEKAEGFVSQRHLVAHGDRIALVQRRGRGGGGHDRGERLGILVELEGLFLVVVRGTYIGDFCIAVGQGIGNFARPVIDPEPIASAAFVGEELVVERALGVEFGRGRDGKGEVIGECFSADVDGAAGKVAGLVWGEALGGDDVVQERSGKEVHGDGALVGIGVGK